MENNIKEELINSSKKDLLRSEPFININKEIKNNKKSIENSPSKKRKSMFYNQSFTPVIFSSCQVDNNNPNSPNSNLNPYNVCDNINRIEENKIEIQTKITNPYKSPVMIYTKGTKKNSI